MIWKKTKKVFVNLNKATMIFAKANTLNYTIQYSRRKLR